MVNQTASEKRRAVHKQNREIALGIACDVKSDVFKSLWKTNERPFRKAPLYRVDSQAAAAAKDLWRAEHRWKLGSYVALLDAFAICTEQGWPHPNWLGEVTADLLALSLFDRDAFSRRNPRLREADLTRLQRQKHCQVFFAIKCWEDLPQLRALERRMRVPKEVENVDPTKLTRARTDSARVDLASRLLLPADAKGQRSNSPSAIEGSLDACEVAVVEQFGGSLGFQAAPWLYLWDLPFLHSDTIERLNLPYSQ